MTLWRGQQSLILASKSSARQSLLKQAGISFEAIPADIDERGIQQAKTSGSIDEVALHLAREKALYVARRHPSRFVVGADQMLALGDRLFNKPADRRSAAAQLRQLAGQTHQLHAALAVAKEGDILFEHISVARMTMRALDDASIENYLDNAGDRVTTSVGAYQIEGLGIHLFQRIEGDHSTILGLPLLPLLKFFREQKLLTV